MKTREEELTNEHEAATFWQGKFEKLEASQREDRAEIERLRADADRRLLRAEAAEALVRGQRADYADIQAALVASEAKLAEALTRIDRLHDERHAEARKADAERAKTAALEQRLENAHDFGAKLMLDQMERAVRDGGKFSDERANRFVTAEARTAKLVEVLEAWLQTPSVPDCGACAALEAALPDEFLCDEAAAKASE